MPLYCCAGALSRSVTQCRPMTKSRLHIPYLALGEAGAHFVVDELGEAAADALEERLVAGV